MAAFAGLAAAHAPAPETAVGSQPIMPTRLPSHSIVVLRRPRLRSRICILPSCRLLRQFNFELKRSQQATDRVDLVAHSAELSFRAWRRWRIRAGAHSERGQVLATARKGRPGDPPPADQHARV